MGLVSSIFKKDYQPNGRLECCDTADATLRERFNCSLHCHNCMCGSKAVAVGIAPSVYPHS